MSLSEFAIIERFFATQVLRRSDVLLGIGDDAALLHIPPQHNLVVTTDTLVAGVHFPTQTDPAAIAHKALAVNLSDLAAMGATPAWFSLALTLPDVDEAWLHGFSQGLWTLADAFAVQLIGGDLTRGPLTITITAHGLLPFGCGLTRSGACVGDSIYVTGELGAAGLALQQWREQGVITDAQLRQRFNCPWPRVQEGVAVRGIARAAIDVSDGLAADVKHLLTASAVGATLELAYLPLADAVSRLPAPQALALALTAGDDYELCFTVADAQQGLLQAAGVMCTRIGKIEQQPGLRLRHHDGSVQESNAVGYMHF